MSVFLSRKQFEELFSKLHREMEKNAQLQARLAAQQATIDWLTVHVNRLETERSLLIRERLHVILPTPEIVREDPAPAAAPGKVFVPPDPDVERGTPPESLAVAQLIGSALEDMGDDAAGRAGITHNPDGTLVYSR